MNPAATHALILAAGRGSRLDRVTDVTPKCLTVVAGRTLLDWMLSTLMQSGIEHVLVVGGYGYASLERYQSASVATRCHARWAETNMLGTLQVAGDWLESHSCLITYCDIAVRSAHLTKLRSATGDVVVANNTRWLSLWSQRFEEPLNDAENFIAEAGVLRKIGGQAAQLSEIGGQFMGLIKTTPKGWRQLNSLLIDDATLALTGDSTKLLARALAANVPIQVVDCDGGWIEIDSESDLHTVDNGLANGDWAHDWRA